MSCIKNNKEHNNENTRNNGIIIQNETENEIMTETNVKGELPIANFLKLKPPTFSSSSIGGDPEAFIQEIEKRLELVTEDKYHWIKLKGFKLEGSAAIWYEIHIKGILGTLTWNKFIELFYERFLPLSMRELKARQFEELKQKNLTMIQYDESSMNSLSMYHG